MFCSGRTIAVRAAGIDAKRPRSVEADVGGEVMTVRSSNPGESGRNADSNLYYRCSASPGCGSAFGDDEVLLNALEAKALWIDAGHRKTKLRAWQHDIRREGLVETRFFLESQIDERHRRGARGDELKRNLIRGARQVRFDPHRPLASCGGDDTLTTIGERHAAEAQVGPGAHNQRKNASAGDPHFPGSRGRLLDRDHADRSVAVILDVGCVSVEGVARGADDLYRLQALEGQKKIRALDRRIDRNVELVRPLRESRARPEDGLLVARRGRHVFRHARELGLSEEQDLSAGPLGVQRLPSTDRPGARPPWLTRCLLTLRMRRRGRTRHDHCGAEYLKDHVLASMAADQHTRTPNMSWFSVSRSVL